MKIFKLTAILLAICLVLSSCSSRKKEEENDPVLDILKQVRRQKEQREQTKEEPFVYQSKKDSKKPSRFKK